MTSAPEPGSGGPPATSAAKPIGPYERLTAEVHEWDPRTVEVARRVDELVRARRPDLRVEHIGSTAVPGLPGKGIVDLSIETDPDDIPRVVELLYELGFGPQPGPDPWPPTRPMPVGSMVHDGTPFRVHLHVQPTGGDFPRDIAFRDALRNDPELRAEYAALKRGITSGGAVEGLRYTHSKTSWILGVYRQLGFAPPPIEPPATIGIVGGGHLARLLALDARRLGYRVAILDPDPMGPAAVVSDHLETAGPEAIDAARRLAEVAAVVTHDRDHVRREVVAVLDDRRHPIRPGPYPLKLTADRVVERRFLEANTIPGAPWLEVETSDAVRVAAASFGYPLRLRAVRGGYDGRTETVLADEAAVAALPPSLGRPMLAGPALAAAAELTVVVARSVDGVSRPFPVARTRRDRGLLVEASVPAEIPPAAETAAANLARDLATAMGLVGSLTVDLLLMPDGSLLVDELAPRPDLGGAWTIEGAITSQFEQHLRAICGLPLGEAGRRAPAAATVVLLGDGAPREARPGSLYEALSEPDVHLHLYDKRLVFERRQMGHVTALGETAGEALERARRAAQRIRWGHA
ncbi:MAG TPA: ATP-grasp domain-containing protein [Candidatus Deferrimicrobiaceae bacterium]|nr:ATP-grasp domain-containing protein [Candidatus Deferrimicrobiaceae bacterium]